MVLLKKCHCDYEFVASGSTKLFLEVHTPTRVIAVCHDCGAQYINIDSDPVELLGSAKEKLD